MPTPNLFPTVRTEGGLLPADLLARLAGGDGGLPGLAPETFHLAGERIGEAVQRAWNRALAAWQAFSAAAARLPEDDPATGLTREKWLLPLFAALDYGRLQPARSLEIEGKAYPVSHLWEHTPIHLVGRGVPLDRRSKGVAGAARASPHGLVQELLNRSDEYLWSLVSNGRRLRLLRDNASLTRQAFVELDLETMMEGQLYPDFVLLWLLCHQSRVEGEPPESCWLERWSQTAREQGTRALERLRLGVERAIETLGRGFLAHPANSELRAKLRGGDLTPQDYYRQLLRQVFRLIFLFVAEDRELLHDPAAPAAARERYDRFYSTTRLRRLAERRRGTPHPDLFRALTLVAAKLHRESCPELALPALGSFLWSPAAIADLVGCDLANLDLLEAVRALALTEDDGLRRAVDYRNLGPEELGSVYEALLELHPQVHLEAAAFDLGSAAGHERKTTGSYYTPSGLIASLLDTALDPVLEEAARQPDPQAAILALRVLDPACGSGHFRITAVHRMAWRLAGVRTGDEEPAPEAVREALRDVIGHCLYGVDLNPMAVELCKVNLWLDALTPGKPLSFLDHHIQCGNSLLGATPRLLAEGIPDDAFSPLEGDDKAYCSELKRRNREERQGQQRLLDHAGEPWQRLGDLAGELARLEAMGDETVEAVAAQEEAWHELVHSQRYEFGRLWADAWCAAFVGWKVPGEDRPQPLTEDVFRRIERNPFSVGAGLRQEVQRLAEEYGFFHWHLAFPEVFCLPSPGEAPENKTAGWSGGFDVVLGNPPWDTLSPDTKEFFSALDHQIRFEDQAGQLRIIESLLEDLNIAERWTTYRRKLYTTVHFIKKSGRYRLFAPGNLGKGDFNVYRMFTETALQLTRNGGFAAQLVPENFYNGANAMAIRRELFDRFEWRWLLGFENRKKIWFSGIDTRTKFALYSALKSGSTKVVRTAFNIRTQEELEHAKRTPLRFPISLVHEFSPIALAFMEFDRQLDIDIVEKMYSRFPKFGDKDAGPPYRQYMREVDMGTDRGLFSDGPPGIPVYEGRMVAQYDHRAKGYRSGRGRSAVWEELSFSDPGKGIQPQWWIREEKIPEKVRERYQRYRIGFCDVASPTNERSLVAALIPPGCICGHKVPTIIFDPDDLKSSLIWLAVANSFTMDFLVRKKVSLAMTYTILDSMPFPRVLADEGVATRLARRVVGLTCTGPEMAPLWSRLTSESWSADCELIKSEKSRNRVTAEIDAIVALHVFGLSRAELDHILESFPTVRKRDKKRYGDYRSKLVILDLYDRMVAAMAEGERYETVLEPKPAAPEVAHLPRRREDP